MDAINTALSGMNAAELRVRNGANNLANQNSKDFTPTDVVQTQAETGGVRVDVVEREPATLTVADADGATQEVPNVSPEEEIVEQIVASNSYKANAQVLKRAADLQESLVNISA
jgi:flagellar basal body rod protein FlgC